MSQSVMQVMFVTEIEAAEACKWLRAAGFPQYAQMYEGKSLPCKLRLEILYVRQTKVG